MGPISALFIGIILMMFLVIRTKIQAFPSLIFSALVMALLSGLNSAEAIKAVTAGFGNTMTSIGIVIGLGCVMGKFMEKSGAAKRMALTILKLVGINKADIVLGLTGFLVSIPVFCDSGFVILSSLAKEFSRLTKKSMILIGGMLGMGLYITHFLVPPTPGPLAVASTLGIDIGVFIIAGLAMSVPLFITAIFFFRWVSQKFEPIIPERDEESLKKLSPEQKAVLAKIEAKQARGEELNNDDFNEMLKDETLPPAGISFATLIVPVLLILSNTIADILGVAGTGAYVFDLIGTPVTAIFISVLMSIYLLYKNLSRDEAIHITEAALSDAGLIVFVTAAGGALGNVIKVTGAGTMMAEWIISLSLPVILVPLLVGTILRFPQGSGTVAMITGSAIIAPMIATLGINPVIAGLAICTTAMCPSYMNDSYFWVVTRFSGLPVKTSLKSWSIATIVLPLVGSIILAVANALIF